MEARENERVKCGEKSEGTTAGIKRECGNKTDASWLKTGGEERGKEGWLERWWWKETQRDRQRGRDREEETVVIIQINTRGLSVWVRSSQLFRAAAALCVCVCVVDTAGWTWGRDRKKTFETFYCESANCLWAGARTQDEREGNRKHVFLSWKPVCLVSSYAGK